jgi:hypothetical protein
MVPDRAAPVLTPTVNVTVPFPDPVLPPLTRIHAAFATAVHWQSEVVDVTVRLAPVTPEPGTATLRGDTIEEQAPPA